ncbi:dephospho-CoA kinase isoform X2 [Elaeis guineensis]|uniref:Dephospho-CoA kinase n=1 Tax=Elaeis guineensis var. tenera TaxID=51953 RepID=A0A8N4F8Q6_ELAGV|nr:dephospho-CoA kinase isoform X2 [Elaeis guineensis]
MSPLSSNARLGGCWDPCQEPFLHGSPRHAQSWPSPRWRKQQRSPGEFFFPIRTRDRRWRRVRAMRIVGLTGGIASGKTTVSNLFKSHGVPVVDADLVARDVVRKGTGGWKKVVAAFGDDILLENGEIDRACLGQIVFSDATKRQLLNRLLAPYISFGIFWEVVKLWIRGSKVIILDVPLLFEAKMDQWTAPIIVVWVDPETQVTRLMARDDISQEQAKNKIHAQTALDWKKTKAHMVIDNSDVSECSAGQDMNIRTNL